LVAGQHRARWTLQDLLSRSRLRPYLEISGQDHTAALALYHWNVQISAAFLESLHYLEIGLRNAMDVHLTRWASDLGATSPWYVDRVVKLSPRTRKAIDDARTRATADGTPELHGRVVAELMLGFWWSLLADEYNRRLWQPCLRLLFDGPVRRRRLHSELNELRRMRNRIAHHEPIHTRDLRRDYARLIDCASRISPVLCTQIETTSRIPDVLTQRPSAALASQMRPDGARR
jgi:hypothetical protein